MKKLIIILACIFATTTAYAQARKIMLPMVCDSSESIQKVLNEYKEEQLFVGQDSIHEVQDMNVMIFLNKKTGTYSVFLLAPNSNMICVVSSGEKGKLIYKD